MKFEFPGQIFEKKIYSYKISGKSIQWKAICSMRKGRHRDMTKLTVTFRNFAKAPKEDWGTRWRSWLRHCATSGKVAGSIPDGVTGFFSLT